MKLKSLLIAASIIFAPMSVNAAPRIIDKPIEAMAKTCYKPSLAYKCKPITAVAMPPIGDYMRAWQYVKGEWRITAKIQRGEIVSIVYVLGKDTATIRRDSDGQYYMVDLQQLR